MILFSNRSAKVTKNFLLEGSLFFYPQKIQTGKQKNKMKHFDKIMIRKESTPPKI